MKINIVSWNCSRKKGGFDNKKLNHINQEHEPDILIIQECKYNECVKVDDSLFPYFTWYGDGKDGLLGIGIFSKKYKLELIPEFKYETSFRYVIPYSLKIGRTEIVLFAVWTKKAIDKKHHKLAYVENIQKAIVFYKDVLKKNVIIIGDFNSADKPGKRRPIHLDLIDKLEKHGIRNKISKELETKPTFYMYFNEKRPFTDDYCFASDDIKITNVDVGKPCLELSDHCPLIVTLDY